MDSTIAKRIWHMVRAVYCMLRKGINKRKLMMDLHLLLHRGKIAGKSLRHLMTTFHHHHHHHAAASAAASAFSCLYVDPDASFYAPREVEFSCSNTPSYPHFLVGKQKHKQSKHDVAAAAIAKVFEILNTDDAEPSAAATPSPAPFVRQLRITDSPFPLREEEGELDGAVDKEAEEFIKRFYEQLRLQPSSVGSTPECRSGRRKTSMGRA